MEPEKKTIWERLLAGTPIPMDDPEYGEIGKAVNHTLGLSVKLRNATHVNEVRKILSQIIGKPIDGTTVVFPPFYTNVGKHISLGKNVFINHDCSFLDLGGITIENGVMIGPKVSISSENHPADSATRKTLVPAAVRVCKNAWIGAGASILPGVTVGENAVVAAGAVVNKDVPANTVVAGVPAKVIRRMEAPGK